MVEELKNLVLGKTGLLSVVVQGELKVAKLGKLVHFGVNQLLVHLW